MCERSFFWFYSCYSYIFSQDIFSYNKEQAQNDTHNMIPILMEYYGYTLQEAVDRVGEMCKETIDTFMENQKRVPSFGDAKLDKDVAGYVEGLQNWIVGSLHWTFMSKRYFGDEGLQVKKHRWVKLLPKKNGAAKFEPGVTDFDEGKEAISVVPVEKKTQTPLTIEV